MSSVPSGTRLIACAWPVSVRAGRLPGHPPVLRETAAGCAPRHVEQAAGRDHVARVENLLPASLAGAVTRLTRPACAGLRARHGTGARAWHSAGIRWPAAPSLAVRPGATAPARTCGGHRWPVLPGWAAALRRLRARDPRPGDATTEQDEDGEHDHAERESGDGNFGAQTDGLRVRMLPDSLQCDADDDKQQSGHEHHSTDDNQGDDYPHTSGGAWFWAHCTTIASRKRPRKPYRQVRA
jgi:hypothetical protein